MAVVEKFQGIPTTCQISSSIVKDAKRGIWLLIGFDTHWFIYENNIYQERMFVMATEMNTIIIILVTM